MHRQSTAACEGHNTNNNTYNRRRCFIINIGSNPLDGISAYKVTVQTETATVAADSV